VPLSPGDEPVEWIDRDGRVIEVVTRRRMRSENLLHRSVGIVVHARDGRLLVHRRADDKDLHPGRWDLIAGGVVGAGEDDDTAAERELAEELGLIDADLVPLGRASWIDDDSSEICRLHRVVHDGPYRFADGEVAEARLIDPDELDDLRLRAAFMPGSLAMLADYLDAWRAGRPVDLRWATVQRVEFTIEPFVEGRPGPHVTAAIEAARQLGHEVEVGPFGSGCTVPGEAVAELVGAVLQAAITHGADHVNVDVQQVGAPE
jgi:8-oxo-dGTP pyrophosphatase MutT (NUDIX family)/uncharacterized protein YqgV (UPF0045/DUF77 family)